MKFNSDNKNCDFGQRQVENSWKKWTKVLKGGKFMFMHFSTFQLSLRKTSKSEKCRKVEKCTFQSRTR